MTDTPTTANTMTSTLIKDQVQTSNQIINDLFHASKINYERKATLIDNAQDMSTSEKLKAHDENYDRYVQEVWHTLYHLGALALVGYVIVTYRPNLIKEIRRLAA